MHWKQFYYVRDYLRSSLWIIPLVAIPLELAATRILHRLDGWLGWTFLDLGVPGAQAMLNAIITATLSFVVFTFGSLLVALQVASGQLTPRIIATVLVRNDVVRYTARPFLLHAVVRGERDQQDAGDRFSACCICRGLSRHTLFCGIPLPD